MNWEITGHPSDDSDRRRSRPRHRSATPQDNQYWRSTNGPSRSRSQSVSADDTDTSRFTSDTPTQVIFPATGSFRAMVGPWTVLSAATDQRLPDICDGRRDVVDDSAPTMRLTPIRDGATWESNGASSREGSAESGGGVALLEREKSRVTAFPPTQSTGERGLRAYLTHTATLTGRQFLVWTRDRTTLLQTLLFPALSMIMFKVVLGDAIGKATGQNSAFGTVPLVVLVGAMFGSLASGVRLTTERKTGLLTRIYVMPVHRGADLSARIIAELARILLGTIILTLLGMFIGWRFNQGIWSALGIFGVALLYGVAFSTLVLTVALASSNVPLVPIMSLASSLLMFFNSGFSPVSAYPAIIRPVVQNQPMTCAIDTMRALATGAPMGDNLVKTVVWVIVIVAVFIYPALRGYRRAAASRG